MGCRLTVWYPRLWLTHSVKDSDKKKNRALRLSSCFIDVAHKVSPKFRSSVVYIILYLTKKNITLITNDRFSLSCPRLKAKDNVGMLESQSVVVKVHQNKDNFLSKWNCNVKTYLDNPIMYTCSATWTVHWFILSCWSISTQVHCIMTQPIKRQNRWNACPNRHLQASLIQNTTVISDSKLNLWSKKKKTHTVLQ